MNVANAKNIKNIYQRFKYIKAVVDNIVLTDSNDNIIRYF